MIVTVDETGSFRSEGSLEYGIATLVTISDSEWENFSSYLNKLYPNGWKEIKGTNIRIEKRKEILKYIGRRQELKYTSHLFDLTSGSDNWIQSHQKEQVKRIEKAINRIKIQKGHPNLIKELTLIRNQVRNLAISDYSKFILIFELFADWQKYFQFDYVFMHPGRDSWKLKHTIDMQNKPDKFKGLIKSMLSLTTNMLNPNYQIFTPKEWSEQHPFNAKYGIKGEKYLINAKKFYSNFKIGTEQNDPWLILPDLIGNTIHQSIKFRKEKSILKMLKRLKPNRSFAIINAQTGNKNQYYLIRGFDKSKDRKDVNLILREHYFAMKNL